ncbi:MAG: hypothetical protein K6C94_08755 [Candidatus Gastranaerophilales bacterium]|nr:hypothetical protein [Candidatus Gastranaerophilales bacterium]
MKTLKILTVNLIILITVSCFAEFLAYKEACSYFKNPPAYSLKKRDYTLENLKQNMRKPVGLNYKKAPILIYGCSYAYGFALDEKDTFGYKLSELAKRPVYNFAVSSKGLQDALFLLEKDEKVTPEPQYVFYVFINDHVRRMFVNCNKIDNVKYLTYKNKNGKLIQNENKYALSERFYIFGVIKNTSYHLLKKIFDKQIYKLVKLYFLTINGEIHKKYPDAKFVVIDYENGGNSFLSPYRVEDLRSKGIEVVNLKKVFKNELKSDKYRNSVQKDSFRHPNGEAWSLVADYIVKEFNL